MKLLVSRTGYTGEDGVEVILPGNMVSMAMKMLLKDIGEGEDTIVRPAGLGCRDTLRLEAAMALYGNELGEDIDALSTGVDFAMNLDKDEDERGEPFVGMEALKKIRDSGGPERRLVGLFVDGKRTARQGMGLTTPDGGAAGGVTSGCVSPTLDRCIAMGYVGRDHAEPGTRLLVDTGRGASLEAEVTPLPFYKRPKKSAG